MNAVDGFVDFLCCLATAFSILLFLVGGFWLIQVVVKLFERFLDRSEERKQNQIQMLRKLES